MFGLLMKTISSIGTFLALILYKPPKIEDQEAEEENEETADGSGPGSDYKELTNGSRPGSGADNKGFTEDSKDPQPSELSVQYKNGDVMKEGEIQSTDL